MNAALAICGHSAPSCALPGGRINLMNTYIAYYRSPNASADREKGVFEFASANNAGSKANMHDARIRMLELHGSKAVSWVIEKVEIKREGKKAAPPIDGQLTLDFREPIPEKKRKKRTTDRGKVQ